MASNIPQMRFLHFGAQCSSLTKLEKLLDFYDKNVEAKQGKRKDNVLPKEMVPLYGDKVPGINNTIFLPFSFERRNKGELFAFEDTSAPLMLNHVSFQMEAPLPFIQALALKGIKTLVFDGKNYGFAWDPDGVLIELKEVVAEENNPVALDQPQMDFLHFGIICENLQKSVAFYETFFGAKVILEKPAPVEEVRVLYHAQAADLVAVQISEKIIIELFHFPQDPQLRKGVNHIAFRLDSIQAVKSLLERFKKNGYDPIIFDLEKRGFFIRYTGDETTALSWPRGILHEFKPPKK